MAMKPNGKSPVSSNKDEILMFFKDISLAPHETQLRYRLIHFWEAPELFGQSKNQVLMTKFLHPNDYVVPRRSMLSWRLNRRNIFPDKDIIKRYIQNVLVTGFLVGSAEVEHFLHIMQSLNDETKDSACFTRKFYVKSAKALARIEEVNLLLCTWEVVASGSTIQEACVWSVYVVFHNQFLVALKRLQVDKQELVHKSANETVMASTYTRIKAIPIGHIRLINGDNLDTHDGIHNTCCHPPRYRWKDDETTQSVLLLTTINSKTLGGMFVYLKIPTLFTSVIFSSKASRTVNLHWVEKFLLLSQIRLLQCMSSKKTFPHHKVTWLSIGK
ncbi:hypothetical protein HID58_059817 [Brassica napus]|uniref:Uncharacterized protein n=1 Tax=Brassica napus TaxID=3708 RepID=A0ABQ7ZU01_BRANA|nr:hypothetical protein HID58_059817 [Brassica napus]